MKKSPYKQRTKKRKKGCPEGHSMQPTGEKDKKTGKDIMACKKLSREDMMNKKKEKEMDPEKQTGATSKM